MDRDLSRCVSNSRNPFEDNSVAVACQRDGSTALPGVWDYLEVSVSIAGLAFGVNADALAGAGSLAVGGPSMIRVCAPAVRRSTADWASSARPCLPAVAPCAEPKTDHPYDEKPSELLAHAEGPPSEGCHPPWSSLSSTAGCVASRGPLGVLRADQGRSEQRADSSDAPPAMTAPECSIVIVGMIGVSGVEHSDAVVQASQRRRGPPARPSSQVHQRRC